MRVLLLLILGVFVAHPSFARQADREESRYVGSRSMASAVIEWRADHVVESFSGQASIYLEGDHHRRTSSGERYDRSAMTAAHRSYPFDSMIRVTNLDTGRRIVVRVNDRLHAGSEAVIRLSESAADRLGLDSGGESSGREVRIELLSSETVPAVEFRPRRSEGQQADGRFRYRVSGEQSPAEERVSETRTSEVRTDGNRPPGERPAENRPDEKRYVDSSRDRPDMPSSSDDRSVRSDTDDSYTLQIGAFSTLDAARRLATDVEGAWVMQMVEDGERVYRVYFGQFEREQKARVAQDRLKKKGRDSFLRTIPS